MNYLVEFYLFLLVILALYVLIPHLFLNGILKKLHGINNVENYISPPQNHAIITGLLGCLERAIFIVFLYLDAKELVVAWFAMKTAINIVYRLRDRSSNLVRGKFNVFLIGSAMNLIFAFLGYGLAHLYLDYHLLISRQNIILGIITVLLYIFLSILWWWLIKVYEIKYRKFLAINNP